MGSAPRVTFNPNVDTSGNIFQTVVSAATATAGGILSTGYNSLADVSNEAMRSIGKQTGAKSPEDKAAEEQQAALQAEQTARQTAYNDALNDNSIDAISRRELVQLYQGGATSTQIASQLAAAREGKGIYGVRRINANQQQLMLAQPGRAQTLTLGRRSVLGA